MNRMIQYSGKYNELFVRINIINLCLDIYHDEFFVQQFGIVTKIYHYKISKFMMIIMPKI